MKRAITVKRKKRGRPATGTEPLYGVRISDELMSRIEQWGSGNVASRSEAIRRLIELGLKVKQKMHIILGFAVLLAALPSHALCCSSTADCAPGSVCLDVPSNPHPLLGGVCVGGPSPGNDHDRNPVPPVRGIQDLAGTYGNTCSFDSDCGFDSKCAKGSGAIHGTCLSRRSYSQY